MVQQSFLKIVATVLILTFSSCLVFSQSVERINENIGGGSKPVQSESKSNNTVLYIAAGVVVVGLLVWKVLSDRKDAKQKHEGNTDSTKVSLEGVFFKESNEYLTEIKKINDFLPVEVKVGLGEFEREKIYNNLSIGLRIKL